MAAALLAVIALGGCAGEPGPVASPATSSAAAADGFSSEEEALEAAQHAYADYITVSDQIAAEGGESPERVRGLLSEEAYGQELQGFEYLSSNGLRLQGASSYDSISVKRWDATTVETYLCLDLSAVRLVDRAGNDVTPPDRVDRQPFEVNFVREPTGQVLISRNSVWAGDNFC